MITAAIAGEPTLEANFSPAATEKRVILRARACFAVLIVPEAKAKQIAGSQHPDTLWIVSYLPAVSESAVRLLD